jgi:hypothetical protein
LIAIRRVSAGSFRRGYPIAITSLMESNMRTKLSIAAALALASVALSGCYHGRLGHNSDRHHGHHGGHHGDHHRR